MDDKLELQVNSFREYAWNSEIVDSFRSLDEFEHGLKEFDKFLEDKGLQVSIVDRAPDNVFESEVKRQREERERQIGLYVGQEVAKVLYELVPTDFQTQTLFEEEQELDFVVDERDVEAIK